MWTSVATRLSHRFVAPGIEFCSWMITGMPKSLAMSTAGALT